MLLALLAPFALYFGTAHSIVTIWNSSDTFAHGYVILPISLWLIWRRRANFSLYPPQPYWPACCCSRCSAPAGWRPSWARCRWCRNTPSSPCSRLIALALLGPRLAGSLAFPLLFLLFAVPFGEIFVAPLIQFTADFTVGRCAPPAFRCCAAAPASSCRAATGRWSKPAAACAT
jgi:exosortase